MIVMCFDLSSNCIGITFAELINYKITYINTLPVVPKKPNGKDLGYTTAQPKKIEYNGQKFKGFLKQGEIYIPKSEAKRRMADFKNYSHRYLLQNIGEQCGLYLDRINPTMIALEKNKAFNGILTTKLLAEIAGGLYFYAGARKIKLYDYDVNTIRARIRKDVTEFNLYKNGTDKMGVDTKWEIYCRLRAYFEQHHPNLLDFESMSMDESDSLAVFYHLFKEVLEPKGAN